MKITLNSLEAQVWLLSFRFHSDQSSFVNLLIFLYQLFSIIFDCSTVFLQPYQNIASVFLPSLHMLDFYFIQPLSSL